MKHVWTIVASRASIDKTTNNLSLFDVFEALTLIGPAFPGEPIALPIMFSVVSLFERSDYKIQETGQGRMRLLSPSDAELSTMEFAINLSDSTRYRQILESQALMVNGAGIYHFATECKDPASGRWLEQHRVPFEVMHRNE